MATAFAGLLIVWAPIIGTQARHITTPSLLIFVLPFVGYTYLIDTLVTPPPARRKTFTINNIRCISSRSSISPNQLPLLAFVG